jgi:hypothetical protein
MSFGFRSLITAGFGVLHRSASRHQVVHERRLLLRTDVRIAHSP